MTATPFTTEDPRCCGSGTCIIDPEGRCWCGQQWDGRQMGRAPMAPAGPAAGNELPPNPRPDRGDR
jgi:hypothetical protein